MNNGQCFCTSCKKRTAIYRRRTSGEKLCRLCLFRSLVKQTRKAVHYYKMASRASSVLYVVRPEAVGESVVGFKIYRGATKGFELSYHVLCVNGITDCEAVNRMLSGETNRFIAVEAAGYRPRGIVELVKFIESIAARIAKKLAMNYVATPLFRDELTILSLMGILTTSRTVFSEGMPVKDLEDSGIKIARPFFYAVSTDFSVLKVLEGVDVEPRLQLECDEFMVKAKRILYDSPELMYSSIKSVELLQTYAFGSTTKCRYCGAFSTGSVCEVCQGLQRYIDAID